MPPKNEVLSQVRKDMLDTFSTESGEKILRWLVQRCDFDKAVWNFDPYEITFREGRRSIIIDILNELRNPMLSEPRKLVSELESPVYERAEVED